ncbi:MAG: hypothetical protein Q7S44_01525 [bacterium]|nr:hypothetical protein [bacterium]
MNITNTSVSKVAINLLPPEILQQRRHDARLIAINRISVGVLIVLIFFTSATLTLRFTQNNKLQKSEQALVYAQSQISQLGNKEANIAFLKQRLATIESLQGADITTRAVFNLILSALPSGVQITDLSIDKKGKVNISLTSGSLESIDALLASLTRQENDDFVARIDLDGLSVSKGSLYRLSLKIGP